MTHHHRLPAPSLDTTHCAPRGDPHRRVTVTRQWRPDAGQARLPHDADPTARSRNSQIDTGSEGRGVGIAGTVSS